MDIILKGKIERVKSLQKEQGAACALLLSNGESKVCFDRGVKPLLQAHAQGQLAGAVLCDKVVGKAAAMLAAFGGVSALHARLISTPAIAVLERAGIPYTFDEKCERIVNRRGDGLCPMESAVMDTDDPRDALPRIMRTLKELREKEEQTP
ncbi:MAG: DUF1893 domain-containing protein [Clostridia bacterium]|nr:DUF1893 domain-containing protein [Clostridia bacterium]